MTNITVDAEHIGKKIEVMIHSKFHFGLIVGIDCNNDCFNVFFSRGQFEKTILSVHLSQIRKIQNNLTNFKF